VQGVKLIQIRQSLLKLQFTVAPLSERIGGTAADLIEQHALSHGIQVADALIAATALDSNQPLCTSNTNSSAPSVIWC
jgi:hypothetical protein